MVEITAPPMRNQIVNALNSGADVFMADFEDSLSPTWANILGGHYNLMKAIKRNLRFYLHSAKGTCERRETPPGRWRADFSCHFRPYRVCVQKLLAFNRKAWAILLLLPPENRFH